MAGLSDGFRGTGSHSQCATDISRARLEEHRSRVTHKLEVPSPQIVCRATLPIQWPLKQVVTPVCSGPRGFLSPSLSLSPSPSVRAGLACAEGFRWWARARWGTSGNALGQTPRSCALIVLLAGQDVRLRRCLCCFRCRRDPQVEDRDHQHISLTCNIFFAGLLL